MKYDVFVNQVVSDLTNRGLITQPHPIAIDGKMYFDEVWYISFRKNDSLGHTANFALSKVIEKTENTNPVLAMIRKSDSTTDSVFMNVAYANDISNFYPVKVHHIYLTADVNSKTGEITYSTVRETTYDLDANDYQDDGYPLKDSYKWSEKTNGYGSFVKRGLVSSGLMYWKDNVDFVSSMSLFNSSYGAYTYFVGGTGDGDFSEQTVWNVYVDPRHSDGDYLDPNIKITWHNELLDKFLNVGGDGSAYSVKVWGGIPKLRSDASGGMAIQTIEIGEYDYSAGNLLTSYSGVYSEVSSAHGSDFLYELFHGKVCYILFAVYKSGKQCSSLCYISCKNKVPDTSTNANVIAYGQVGNSFTVLLDNKINDVSIVNVSIGTGEDDSGANNDNNDDDDEESTGNHNNVNNSMELLTAGLISVYNVTPEKLNQLGRFIWTDSAMDDIKLINNSPIQNIVSCKCIPFLASDTTAKNIALGNIDTGVTGNRVNSNIGKILIGSVNVTPPFNNFLSYGSYTSVSIYLPYLGMRQLDTDKVMGKTLKVYYNVDCLSGNCVIELFSNNIKINEFSCNVSIDIALTSSNRAEIEKGYITSAIGGGVSLATGNVIGALGSGLNASTQKYNYTQSGVCSGSAYTNISKNCYIIIEYPDLLDNNSYKHTKGKPCEKRKRIGTCKGFTTISNVDLQVKATETEINAIKELLSNGVYL